VLPIDGISISVGENPIRFPPDNGFFDNPHHTDPRAHQRLAVIYMISIGA
jgi:hypothetical protein